MKQTNKPLVNDLTVSLRRYIRMTKQTPRQLAKKMKVNILDVYAVQKNKPEILDSKAYARVCVFVYTELKNPNNGINIAPRTARAVA